MLKPLVANYNSILIHNFSQLTFVHKVHITYYANANTYVSYGLL